MKARRSFRRAELAVLLIIAIGIYVIVPQLGGLSRSLSGLKHPDPIYLAAALLLMATTYVLAALNYKFLSFKHLPFRDLLWVQLAGTFANRILPAGSGALGTSYLYFRKQKISRDRAAAMITINNLLGMLGHLLLITVLLTFFRSALPPGQHVLRDLHAGRLAVISIIITLFITVLFAFRNRLQMFFRNVFTQMLAYRRAPARIVLTLASSVLLTICNVLWFEAGAHAAHVNLAFLPCFVIFSFGIALGTATPTPGGLGGVEAGLFAGMIAYGIQPGHALAAALLYRLTNFWLALLIGFAAFSTGYKRLF